MPATLTCWQCQGRLIIYADQAKGGQWFHCRGCGRCGDMVELAAWKWQLEPDHALDRLQAKGSLLRAQPQNESVLSSYLRHINLRQRILAYWEKISAGNYCLNSGCLQGVMAELGVSPYESSLWHATVGRCLAGDDSYNFSAECSIYGRGLKRANKRMRFLRSYFEADDWGDVLLSPYWALPGQLCGMWLYGQAGRQLYQSVGSRGGGILVPAGLGLLPQVLEPVGDGTVFVFQDMALAMRLLALQSSLNDQPLPLVVAQHDETPMGHSTSFVHSPLLGRPFVYWAEKLTDLLLSWARTTGGRIVLDNQLPGSLRSRLGYYGPVQALAYLATHARPWHELLAEHITGLTEQEAERTIYKLKLQRQEIDQLTAQVTPQAGGRLQRAAVDRSERWATVHGVQVKERATSWYHGEVQLADAVVRLDRASVEPDGDGIVYEGRILSGAYSLPFRVTATQLECDGMRWAAAQLLQAGYPPLHYDVRWATRLLELALAFSAPEVTGSQRLGWNQDGGIRLAGFTIMPGGRIQTARLPLTDTGIPTLQLRPPIELTGDVQAALKQPGQETAWCVTAAVLSNVLAPAYGLPTSGIALVGSMAALLGQAVATTVGCCVYHPVVAKAACRADLLERAYGWPVLVRRPPQQHLGILYSWLRRPGPRNCVIALNRWQALTAPGGWHLIEDNNRCWRLPETRHFDTVPPAFLAWLLKRQLELPPAACLGQRVYLGLQQWLVEHCGAAIQVAPAGWHPDCSCTTGDAADSCRRFRDMVNGIACLLPPHHRCFPLSSRGCSTFISEQRLAAALGDQAALLPDVDQLTVALLSQGLLQERFDDHATEPGWLVPTKWLEG